MDVPGGTDPTVTERLIGLLRRPVDAAALGCAIDRIVDWVGTAVAGGRTPEGAALVGHAAAKPVGPCLALGVGRRDEDVAALVNGGLGITLEMDDVHRAGRVHPGDTVIPTALAAAQLADATGRDMLAAVVRGYEATIRVAGALGPEHYRYWHPTATTGPFGAAVAAGMLLDLSDEQLGWAIGNAGTQAAGLWQTRIDAAMSKALHAGRAAQAGLLAARLAAGGFSGPHRILEGERGLFAAMAPSSDPEAVLVGRPWRIREVSTKPWPACRHTHPAIDAALGLRGALSDPARITRVEVSTYAEAIDFADEPRPTTDAEARFSLQHAVTVGLLAGDPGLEHFSAPYRDDPATVAVRSRVTVAVDPGLDAAYPAHWGACVTVLLDDGSTLLARRSDARGDPELPLSRDGVAAKTQALLSATGVASSDAEEVLASVAGLGTAPDVVEMTAALEHASRQAIGPLSTLGRLTGHTAEGAGEDLDSAI